MQDTEKHLTGRVVAMPANTNSAGDIFGGWLLAQSDLAGSSLAVRLANGRVATVAVAAFRFLKPVRVGDLVSCWASLIRIGTTSLTIRVEVEVERMRMGHEKEQVATGEFVYVALDEHGRPRPVDSP
jgi:acyl-CoA thioesterase YciA